MDLGKLPIDKTWTLFLDRDGVINLLYPSDYVKKWSEFFFLEGSLEGMKMLAGIFKRIIIVTNQQGVGKGLMTEADLQHIHDEMLKEVRKYGGRIHAIYSANELVENDVNQMRKPHIGMALKAKKDFKEIDFARSIMVGDSITDMQFGKSAGMYTVYVGDAQKLSENQKLVIDVYCDSLLRFAESFSQ